MIMFLAVVTAGAWSFGFSKAFHLVYLTIGEPEQSSLLLWLLLVSLSFLFGAVGAFFISKVTGKKLLQGTLLFLIGAVAFIFSVAIIYGGLSALVLQLESYGFWAFLFGICVFSMIGKRVWHTT